MKKKKMKLAAACFAMLCFASYLSATDIYLSSDGNDGKDGSSPSNAVATLTKALSLIPNLGEDYVIKVSGFIDISKEISGNSGVVLNRKIYFTIEGDAKETCGFDGNEKTRLLNFQGGGGSAVLKNLTLKNGNTSSGGAINVANSNGFVIDGCIIKNNKATGRGGAIAIANSSFENKTIVIRNTLIALNESTNDAAGGIYVNNETVNNSMDVSIVNSTIYGNLSRTYGGAVFVAGAAAGSSFSLINSTLVENQTQGNGGHGAGICFRDAASSITSYIYNSIIEENIAINNGSSLNSDITSNYNFNNDNFFLRHSYVGIFLASAVSSYVDLPEYNNRIKYNNTREAGLAKPSIDYINSQNSIPLEFDSDALEKGNAQYLQALNINTDQLGNTRLFKNGKCAVGAVEVPAELVITNPYPHEYKHFFIYGQSLSVGQESSYPISVENVEGNYMLGEQIWFNYGNKNFDQLNPLVSTPALSISLTCENPLTAAVNQIRKKQHRDFPEIENRFIATSSGTGARPIADLSKGSAAGLYERDFLPSVKHAKRNATRQGSAISCPAIFWLQGENDYNAQLTPKDDYKAAMVKLKNDMQADIMDEYGQESKPIFYTYQTGGIWTNGNRALLIGMAQLEASNQYKDIICVGPTYQLSFGNDHLNNHLCSNGSRWFGEYMGKVYYKTQVLGEDFKPLQPKVLYRDAQNPKKIIVRFHVPKPPLVFDEFISPKVQNYGFSVYMNNGKQTITSVQIVDDCVEITCANNLTAAVDVLYGEKNTMDGHGNLRDSDDYLAESNYVDADAKDENGNYVYPRTGEASFRPKTPEPKDETGSIIYNKPYPLYNYGLAFTYTIPAGESSFTVPNMDGSSDDVQSAKATDNIQIRQSAASLRVFVAEATRLNVTLTDVSGKAVGKLHDAELPAQSTIEYDLTSLASGIYIVNVQTSNASKAHKILINR